MGFTKTYLTTLSSVFALLSLSTSSVFAGSNGQIIFAPVDPSAIPTLSSTMLIVLSLLLVAVAFRVSKNKESNSSKFLVAIIGAAALFTGGGVKLVSDLKANVTTAYLMSDTGGNQTIQNAEYNQYQNDSNVSLRVESISLPTSCETYNAGQNSSDNYPLCRVGTILSGENSFSGEDQCEIDCRPIQLQPN